MVTTIDKLTADGCFTDDKHKVCRSRGGESCAFDGAMIVLQPIADTAHIVHGPIACCGNSWEGRGTLAKAGANGAKPLHRMGFTTDMGEIDIVYGSAEKLYQAIVQTHSAVSPKAIFVYSTCVSGLVGEDIDAVCRKAGLELGIRVIPVNAPGFVGPKNLGNRIAGEVLLEHVIGTGEPAPPLPPLGKGGARGVINLIGEYNIAGDLWLIEPLLAKAGIRVLSRITGDSTFEEITHAHRAKLNVVVCGRALINVARGMERQYNIPFVEVSFFGSTEIAKALRLIAGRLQGPGDRGQGSGEDSIGIAVEGLIRSEEKKLKAALKPYQHLRSKKAVLYSGGVKSWSFISALMDLGIEVVAIGTKKSTFEDEEKMKQILGPDAPLVEDVTPKNLLKLLRDRKADMLIAGGRNQYLAIKEGFPFVDVNQERHTPYAGYEGLVNLAEQISNGMRFYRGNEECGVRSAELKAVIQPGTSNSALRIDPLKHSPAIGAAMALQGVHNALPLIHGAQGCGFLGKVLLTKHFREPIALATTKLFVENVVMGSEDAIVSTAQGFIDKNRPDLLAVLTSGLAEVKGDDVKATVKLFQGTGDGVQVIHIPTPDYDSGLEKGYAKAVEAILLSAEFGVRSAEIKSSSHPLSLTPYGLSINILAGSHLTPADCTEIRSIVRSFGMRALILPDLSALDGSRQGFSPLSAGGITLEEVRAMGSAAMTIALGANMEAAAKLLRDRCGVDCRIIESAAGLEGTDQLLETLAQASGRSIPDEYVLQRRVLVDGMRDAHFFFAGRKVCIALEPDHAVQVSTVLDEMSALVELAVIPTLSDAADSIRAESVVIGDLFSVNRQFDLLVANSHAEDRAREFKMPLYQTGFPVYKVLGHTAKVTIGYRGTLAMINEMGTLMMKGH